MGTFSVGIVRTYKPYGGNAFGSGGGSPSHGGGGPPTLSSPVALLPIPAAVARPPTTGQKHLWLPDLRQWMHHSMVPNLPLP